jgi:hypothetical protein
VRYAVRLWTWIVLGVAGCLMCLSFPVFPNDIQAFGNNLAATVLIAGTLVWHILHPPPLATAASLSPATEALKPAT